MWKTGGIYLVGQALQKVNETTKKIASKLTKKIVGIHTTEDQVVILNFATFTKKGNTLEISKENKGMIRMNHSTLSVLKQGCS